LLACLKNIIYGYFTDEKKDFNRLKAFNNMVEHERFQRSNSGLKGLFFIII